MKRFSIESIIVLAAGLLLLSVHINPLRAQDGEISNVRVEQEYSTLRIIYDLEGEEESYDVELLLQRSAETESPYRPGNLAGDVGEDVVPGKGKTVIWDLAKEFPEGVDPSAVFMLDMKASLQISFLQRYSMYLGGGAIAVGTALYFILTGEEASPPSSLPDPSGRPDKW